MSEESQTAESSRITEVKPSFSLKYFGLVTIATLVPTMIGGALGYFASEYVKDKKIIDVSSTSSGNLISIADNVPNDLQVTFALKENKKETIKGLFRYRITVANKSITGLDDFEIFLVPPNGITVIDPEEIATTPPQLLQAIVIKKELQGSRIHYTVNLLNPGQAVVFSFIGLSQTTVVDKSFSTVVQKKDWLQRDIAASSSLEPLPQKPAISETFLYLLVIFMSVAFGLNLSNLVLKQLIRALNLVSDLRAVVRPKNSVRRPKVRRFF